MSVEQKTEQFEVVLMFLQQLEIQNLWIKQTLITVQRYLDLCSVLSQLFKRKGLYSAGGSGEFEFHAECSIGLY